jgi:hypothetical protein
MIARRSMLTATAAFTGFALLEAVGATKAMAPRPSISARRWLSAQEAIAADLRGGRLRPVAWQAAVEQLGAEVDRAELLAQTDFDRLRATFDFNDGMPAKRFVKFPNEPDGPKLSYGLAFFGFRKGQVITPHGHRHMVSAHMSVAGTFRARTFDRLRDEPGALILRPTFDGPLQTGGVSTMSTDRHNVHWFVAEADGSATLDVIIDGLGPSAAEPYVIDLVDPLGGKSLGDGTVRAPLIGWDESIARYA